VLYIHHRPSTQHTAHSSLYIYISAVIASRQYTTHKNKSLARVVIKYIQYTCFCRGRVCMWALVCCNSYVQVLGVFGRCILLKKSLESLNESPEHTGRLLAHQSTHIAHRNPGTF
jgi:hypothetical protein